MIKLKTMQIVSNAEIGIDSILRLCLADRVANLSSITSMCRFIRFAGKTVFAGLIIFCLTTGTTIANDKFLRMSIDLMEGTTFKDVDCARTNPNALYGCGAGRDGAPNKQSVGDFGSVPVAEFGVSRTDGVIRYEFVIEYRPRYTLRVALISLLRTDSSRCRQSCRQSPECWQVMLTSPMVYPNPKFGTPFLGLGIGVAHTRIGKTAMNFPLTTTTVPGGSHTDLAWMISSWSVYCVKRARDT